MFESTCSNAMLCIIVLWLIYAKKSFKLLWKQILLLQCHFCEYESLDLKRIEVHVLEAHGVINCTLCDYGSLDKDLMRSHMKIHTGRINFTCNICEFEATKHSLLEEHVEAKHSNRNKEPTSYHCEICERAFPAYFLLRDHNCTPTHKLLCDACEFRRDTS